MLGGLREGRCLDNAIGAGRSIVVDEGMRGGYGIDWVWQATFLVGGG